MILFLFILACGEELPHGDTSKADRKERRENRKRMRDEKYRVVMDDLEQTKTDMRCIREFVTAQQQIPEEKMDYDMFEKDECEKNELMR